MKRTILETKTSPRRSAAVRGKRVHLTEKNEYTRRADVQWTSDEWIGTSLQYDFRATPSESV